MTVVHQRWREYIKLFLSFCNFHIIQSRTTLSGFFCPFIFLLYWGLTRYQLLVAPFVWKLIHRQCTMENFLLSIKKGGNKQAGSMGTNSNSRSISFNSLPLHISLVFVPVVGSNFSQLRVSMIAFKNKDQPQSDGRGKPSLSPVFFLLFF